MQPSCQVSPNSHNGLNVQPSHGMLLKKRNQKTVANFLLKEEERERKEIMAEERVEPKPIDLGEYKFGFHDDVQPILSTGKGLNEAVIRELSAAKGEPEWMLEFRLKSYETFKKKCPCKPGEPIYQRLTLMI